AVAPALAVAFHLGGRREFEMQLEVGKFVLGADAAGLWRNFHETVVDLPFGGAAIAVLPFRQVLAVEQDDGIRRRGRLMTEGRARSDNARLRTIPVMHVPLRARHERRVFVAEALLFSGEYEGRSAQASDREKDWMLCSHGRIFS